MKKRAMLLLNATAWSSPNGATVNVDAVPNGYAEGQKAEFCVRLEGEEIARVPCEWDGKSYKASADLNAADGYCYYCHPDFGFTCSKCGYGQPYHRTESGLCYSCEQEG